jgi:hypothetical protein
MSRVPLERVDRTVMLSRFDTEPVSDFDNLSLVSLEDVTLLGTD